MGRNASLCLCLIKRGWRLLRCKARPLIWLVLLGGASGVAGCKRPDGKPRAQTNATDTDGKPRAQTNATDTDGKPRALANATENNDSNRSQASYVGVMQCGTCHDAALAFWNNTRHARAYFTLVEKGEQHNAACVGCHVTGFEKPGGSTLSLLRGALRGPLPDLTGVQCETCHGPGSLHAANGKAVSTLVVPGRALCLECHTPPNVPEGWNVEHAWPQIIGSGHGDR
jgi:predicted CXXCH cytochrome family protein